MSWDPPVGCNDKVCMFDLEKVGGPTQEDMLKMAQFYRQKKGRSFVRVAMTPDEYMKLCATTRGGRIDDEYSAVVQARVKKYVGLAKKGAKFPVPVAQLVADDCDIIDLRDARRWTMRQKIAAKKLVVAARQCVSLRGAQEGRHRAMTAKALGIKLIPVFIELPITGWNYEKGKTLDGYRRR